METVAPAIAMSELSATIPSITPEVGRACAFAAQAATDIVIATSHRISCLYGVTTVAGIPPSEP
jgi:hypothetical protein